MEATPKLRVWNFINLPSEPIYQEVSTPEEAYHYINQQALKQLTWKWVESNAFGLEVWNEDDQEWEEWMDEDYNEIDAWGELQGLANPLLYNQPTNHDQ